MNLNTLNIITPQGQRSLIANPGQAQVVEVEQQTQFHLADAVGLPPKQIKLLREEDNLVLLEGDQVVFILNNYYAQTDASNPLFGVEEDGQYYNYPVDEYTSTSNPVIEYDDYITVSDLPTLEQAASETSSIDDSSEPWVFTGLASLGAFAGIATLDHSSFDRQPSDRKPSEQVTIDNTPVNNFAVVANNKEAKLAEATSLSTIDAEGLPTFANTSRLMTGSQPTDSGANSSYRLGNSDASASYVDTTSTDSIIFSENYVSSARKASSRNAPATIFITEEARPGEEVGRLTAKINDANGVPRSGVTYQWFADGQEIHGATKSSYKLISNEAGKTITVKASYTDNAGFKETITSNSDTGIYIPKSTSSSTTSGGLVVDVTDAKYGAKGDGRADDTAAIQKAISEVSRAGGGTVLIPEGTYMIDTGDRIRMRSNVTVKMDEDTVLEAIPNALKQYDMFYFANIENAHLIGGNLIGDRDSHLSTKGEWGNGVRIVGSKNVVIENVSIKDFWGDGIYIGESKEKSEDIIIYSVIADNNRRQGITIVDGDGIKIINSVFMNTNGAKPASGIAIEPNDNDYVTNVDIFSSKFMNNEIYGMVISERANGKNNEIDNVHIEGNEVLGNGRNVLLNGVTDSEVVNNIIDTANNGLPGISLNPESEANVVSSNLVITNGTTSAADVNDRSGDNTVGNNYIIGTNGNDLLKGSKGQDILTGLSGSDTFIFSNKIDGKNVDTIYDFSTNENDKIGLSHVIFGNLTGDWFAADGERVTSSTRIIQKGDDLYYDRDGSGSTYSQVHFATVDQTLTVDDFTIL